MERKVRIDPLSESTTMSYLLWIIHILQDASTLILIARKVRATPLVLLIEYHVRRHPSPVCHLHTE